jgi:hypothetical protein
MNKEMLEPPRQTRAGPPFGGISEATAIAAGATDAAEAIHLEGIMR